MSTSDIIWEDPPTFSRRRGPGVVGTWADAVKASPGKWAKWPKPVSPGAIANFKRYGLDVTTRTIPDTDPKRYDLYAIYMPQDGVA